MKTAIITGGARGLGEGMVLKLAEMGYNVVVNYVSDNSKELSDRLIERIKVEYGVNGLAVQADVSDYSQCKKIVDKAAEKFGQQIDVLVNNAGITNNLSFLTITPEQYSRVIQVNLLSYMHMCHLVLPFMAEAKQGSIINISSIGGLMGVSEQGDYCASKAGVIGLTRGLAVEFGKSGIRINAIAPGMIWTDMLRGVDQIAVEHLKQSIPQGKIGDVEDIAGAMAYLIDASYMTGQTVSPNGGIVMP
ncbi:MAG: SDR family oxidoreductase [Firmicutes bacterium]|nr:SDR family oxidoreductase [Bacillota bacterium]